MNRTIFILFIFIAALVHACGKKEQSNSGTVTINNDLTQPNPNGPYYGMGLNIVTGKTVTFANTPYDVLTVDASVTNGVVDKLYLMTNSMDNSFAMYGEYPDKASALSAFNSLRAFNEPAWVGIADSIAANQIWLFRTTGSNYAKILIISTTSSAGDVKPHAACTLTWVYQPDGTKLFP
ncbi:MAG TPA: hypothetical protein VMT63_12930 [Bacteroidales bacterium]|nr:hypothetical protein [Bacteroidales bacterium]